MHRIILAAALTLASAGASAEITCDKPEYLQLKTADKAELTDEYCRAKRKFELVLGQQAEFRESASRLSAQGLDASKAREEGKQALDKGMSCSRASADYMGALERRFKLRQRPSCQ